MAVLATAMLGMAVTLAAGTAARRLAPSAPLGVLWGPWVLASPGWTVAGLAIHSLPMTAGEAAAGVTVLVMLWRCRRTAAKEHE